MADVFQVVDNNGTEFDIADAAAREEIATLERKTSRTSGTCSSFTVGGDVAELTVNSVVWYKSGGMCYLYIRASLTTTGETPTFNINDAPKCALERYFGCAVYRAGDPVAIDGYFMGYSNFLQIGFKSQPISGTFGWSIVYPLADSEL